MQPIYKVGRIARRQIDPAYLLLRPVVPKLDLASWRAFCQEMLVSESRPADQDDIVVAANPVGYVQGLCLCAVRGHLLHGRILDVSIFVVASAADAPGVANDLLGYLRTLAKGEACGAIRVWTLWQDNWRRDLGGQDISWRDQGVQIILD
jgi:hypothetical protein